MKKRILAFFLMVTLVFTVSYSSDNKQTDFGISNKVVAQTVSEKGKDDESKDPATATAKKQNESTSETIKSEQDKTPSTSKTDSQNNDLQDNIEATVNSTLPQINSEMEVHFLNVGQGDSALIICDGKAMLIDGGDAKSSSLIYAYLKQRNINELEYIIATHGHADHVGGLSGALNYATVKRAISSTSDYDSKTFSNFLNYLGEIELESPNLEEDYSLGSANFTILAPRNKADDENNNSIVVKLTHGDNVFLFTGDAEREEEQSILSAGLDIKADVLKVEHKILPLAVKYFCENRLTVEKTRVYIKDKSE